MKTLLFIVFFLMTFFVYDVQTQVDSDFIKPWNDKEKPIIIDVYCKNDYTIEQIKKEKRIKGIIHKLSEQDSNIFYQRRKQAYQNNLLFGSYWLPKHNTDGKKQADDYLKMVGKDYIKKEFLALDFEMHKTTKEFISPHNAYLFVTRIYEKTGRYPHIYSSRSNLKKLENSLYQHVFKKCKLWIIALTDDGDISETFIPTKKSKKIWTTYSLWQFGCEMNCCKDENDTTKKPCFYKVDDFDCGIDYNIFNGNEKELVISWNS
ncbi:glycoside hydrolase family 25 protein [Bernardetia sp.]|uniref:glycoside hydrolase family 25 protein n=1 Tax=Bernardetia sp. TaxID=1937974 RepID=UPI0025BCB695|nr:glycoside hydrolase family 25 protein [Bernardetia sp.]